MSANKKINTLTPRTQLETVVSDLNVTAGNDNDHAPLLHKSSSFKKRRPPGILDIFVFALVAMDDNIQMAYINSLLAIFTERHVDSRLRSFLSYAVIPVMFKVLTAPFTDKHFISWMGRRKTYIYPCKIFTSLFCLTVSFYIDDLVENNEVIKISLLMLIYSFILMPLINAMNSLRLEHFTRENSSYIGAVTTLNFIFGSFFGFWAFTLLNSDEWCQKHLHTEGAVISHRAFWLFLALINTLSLPAFFLFQQKAFSSSNISDEISLLSSFKVLLNPKLPFLKFFGVICALSLSTMCVRAASMQYYLKNGIKKEKVIIVYLLVAPIGILMSMVWGKYSKGPHPMKKVWLVSSVLILNAVLHILNIHFMEPDNHFRTLAFLFCIMCVDMGVCDTLFTASAINKTASKIYGSTYLASASCLLSIARFFLMFVFLPLIDYVRIEVGFAAICIAQLLINFFVYSEVKDIDAYKLRYYQQLFEAKVEGNPLPDRETFRAIPKDDSFRGISENHLFK